MDKENYIEILTPHKEYLTTVRKWNEYAEQHELPSWDRLRYTFQSWNNLKSCLNLTIQKKSYSKLELKNIGIQHREHFTTIRDWDDFIIDKSLPSAITFIKCFGSWEKTKTELGITNIKRKRDIYSKQDIFNILKKHRKYFENRQQWDVYAKDNKLPTYKTILKHYDYNEILSIVNKPKTFKLTKSDLLKIGIEHQEKILNMSMTQWNDYAANNSLPSSYTFIKQFGSWNKAKHDIKLHN